MSESGSRSEVVLAMAEEFLERYRRGERPSLKEYIHRHPSLAAEIREVFPAMALMENVALADDSLAGDPTGPAPATTSTPPQQLGDFRILREIGKGGMGIVYEAEQISLGRHVALKVLPRKLLLDDAQKRRFEREARAAARLHHTNIVPVFGVGEQDGLPYYVMQLIQGLGLDAVCDELKHMRSGSPPAAPSGGDRPPTVHRALSAADMAHSLVHGSFLDAAPSDRSAAREPPVAVDSGSGTVSGTLSLSSSSVTLPGSAAAQGKSSKSTYWQSVARIGVQVAGALEYAHKQGIQHRDVKPSNLLLDTRGTVWVTDFGLARADNEEHLTQTGDIVGTLRYMPPEAFDGRTDTRSDLYSLGLTLYELLALRPAFAEKDRHKLIKQLTTEEPARLDRLERAIPRDLVTIVHKAIDREPARRYPTAAELAADLQRFLDDEPIRARPISPMERLGRWCRHHPGVASLTAVLAVLLLAVTAASLVAAGEKDVAAKHEAALRQQAEQAQKQAEEATKQAEANLQEAEHQRQRAEANFDKARKAVDDSFTTVSESQLLTVPGMQPLRRDLLQSALMFYQDFLRERGGDPALQAELAATFLRVGRIHKELGEADKAHTAWEKARELYEALARAEPQSAAWQHGRAQCYLHLNRVDEAIALWQKLVQPDQPRFQPELADAYNLRGRSRATANRVAEALQAYQQALAIREMLVRLDRDDPAAQYALGQSLNNIATLLIGQQRLAEALAMLRRAADHAEAAFARAPHLLLYGRLLAIAQANIGLTERRLGHFPEALAAYRVSAEAWRKLARDNPAVPEPYSQLFRAYRAMAFCQQLMNQPQQYERTMRQAHELLEQLPSDGPEALFTLACVRAEWSTLLAPEKGKQTAEDLAEQKREADRAMEALNRAVAAGFRDVARLRGTFLLNPLRGRDDFKALEADLAVRLAAAAPEKIRAGQQALELRQKMAQADPKNKKLQAGLAASRHAVALILLDLGKLDEARKHLEQAVALREALVQEEPKNTQYWSDLGASRLALGDFFWQSGKLSEAVALWQRQLEMLEHSPHAEKEKALVSGQLATMQRTMAQTYARTGLWAEAAAAYDRLLSREEMTDRDYLRSACVALRAGNAGVYRRSCAALAARLGNAGEIGRYCDLAWMHCLAEKPERDPAQILQWAGKQDPTGNVWRYHVLGLAHYRAGHLDEAITWAAKSIRNEEYTARIMSYPLLALAHHRLGHAAEARHWLDKARDQWKGLSPLPRAITGMTVLPGYQDHWSNAWQDWVVFEVLLREAALAITGSGLAEDGYDHAHRSLLYVRLGKQDQADAHWQQAVKLLPDEPILWLVRARQLVERKRLKEAEAALAKVTQLPGSSAEVWKERGRLYFEVGQRDRATADFRKAVQLLGKLSLPTDTPTSQTDELFQQVALTAFVEGSLDDSSRRWQRAMWYAGHWRWKEAAADFKISLHRDADTAEDLRWLFAAPAIAAADRQGYLQYRRELLERFGETRDPVTAERIAKASLLLADTSPQEERAGELADRAVALGKNHSYIVFFRLGKGLADYRRKHYRTAIEEMEKLLPQLSLQDYPAVQAHLILALAFHGQGEMKAARQHLAQAARIIEQRIPESSGSPRFVDSSYHHDWMITWLLHREARERIDGKKAEAMK